MVGNGRRSCVYCRPKPAISFRPWYYGKNHNGGWKVDAPSLTCGLNGQQQLHGNRHRLHASRNSAEITAKARSCYRSFLASRVLFILNLSLKEALSTRSSNWTSCNINVSRFMRPQLWAKQLWVLLHDNASTHRSFLVCDFLSKTRIAVLPQLSYSPDFAL